MHDLGNGNASLAIPGHELGNGVPPAETAPPCCGKEAPRSEASNAFPANTPIYPILYGSPVSRETLGPLAMGPLLGPIPYLPYMAIQVLGPPIRDTGYGSPFYLPKEKPQTGGRSHLRL